MTPDEETTPRYLHTLPDDASLLYRSLYTMRWSDMDAFGHVNNAMYFTYFEQARVDWLDSINVQHGLVLANISCTFIQPLKYPAELEVTLHAGPPGRSSLDTYYEVYDKAGAGVLCAIAHGTIVWYDHATGQSREIPGEVRERLTNRQ
jgi:acyl-CoA thioester hydrolase